MEEKKKKSGIRLTKKQELFCKYYVNNGHNGDKAAVEAGYSKKTAKFIASQNLTKLYLIERIKELEQPVLDKLNIDEDWVLTKLKNFSEVDITDFFEIDGLGEIKLKDFKTIPQEKISAIEEIQQLKDGKIKIKLVDKRACIVDIGKHFGMFKDQFEGNIEHNHKHKIYVVPAFNTDNDSSTKPGNG